MNAFYTPGVSVSMRSKFLVPPRYGCSGKDTTGVDIEGPEDSFVYPDHPHHPMAKLIFLFDTEMFFYLFIPLHNDAAVYRTTKIDGDLIGLLMGYRGNQSFPVRH